MLRRLMQIFNRSETDELIVLSSVRKMIKIVLAVLFITLLCAAGYSLFLDDMQLCLFPVAAVTTSSLLIISRSRRNQRKKSYEYQFLWLMEYVSTALSTGAALESILVKAAEDINEQSSEKYKEISMALKKLRSGLMIHLDLDRSLQTFITDFPCESAKQILGNIFYLKRSGGRIEQYIFESTRMLREQVELIRSMEAEQSGKTAETYIMSIAPFFMAFILKNAGSFQAYVYHTKWGIYAMAATYLMSCCSVLIAIIISSSSYDNYKRVSNSRAARFLLSMYQPRDEAKTQAGSVLKKILLRGGGKIRYIYKEYLPAYIWQRINSQLRIDALVDSNEIETIQIGYFAAKLLLVILYVLVILPLIVIDIELAYLLVLLPFVILSHDFYLLSRYRQRSSQENMRFPQWLNLLSILLNSGLSLQRSLQICSRNGRSTASGKPQQGIDYFDMELKRLQRQIGSGISPSILISELSNRCTILQIKYVLDLIVRYERDGGKEILGIIALSAGSTWQVYRDELKKKLQSKNLLLLIPCGLSLVSVIATALIPAASMLVIGN